MIFPDPGNMLLMCECASASLRNARAFNDDSGGDGWGIDCDRSIPAVCRVALET